METMKTLRLSTAPGLESNKALLLAHLFALGGRAPVGEPGNPLHVQLQVDDGCRDTLLGHVKALYDAALQHHVESSVSVIPVVSCRHDASSALPTTFDSTVMTADHGFEPSYRYVALGGTFDRLHAGHKLLLTTAAFYATKGLHVGVTEEAMLANKAHGSYIEPFEVRCAAVSRLLRSLRSDIELNIVGISDRCGGTEHNADIEALVVSPETASALTIINTARASNGLSPLHPIHIPYVDAGGNERISSTELRRRCEEKNSGDMK